MFSKICTTALVIGATLIVPMTASAQTLCGPRNGLITKLEKMYDESRAGIGVLGDSAVFEIWTSTKTGSWTMLVTRPDGVACIMAAGRDWQTLQDLQPVGDPA